MNTNTNNNTVVPYVIKTNGSITLYLNGECLTIATDHPNYNKILDSIKSADFANIENLVNIAKAVIKYAAGKISIDNGQIFYGGFALHNTLTERILKMMNEGFKFDHMIKFLENLMQNPSKRAVDETYWFLENYGLPITEDGCFLAYKAVRSDYTDIYSGKFSNAIGAVVSMPRNMVDDNYGVDCSKGLHVGALDYVVGYGHFRKGEVVPAGGNRLLLVKVNPKDVVSVPKYEGHTKMRVCEYTVVSEINDVVKELDKVVYTSNAGNLDPDYDGSDWDAVANDGESEYDESDDNSNEDHFSDMGVGPYDEGYNQGVSDSNTEQLYGYGRDETRGGDYASGYDDGYFGEEYVSPERSETSDSSCRHNCSCGNNCSDSDDNNVDLNDAEYRHGFLVGEADFKNGLEFEKNLDPDYSDSFKTGYRAGYRYADNAEF
jgi:hypothetical protein